MLPHPQRPTRTDTLFPYTTLCRSAAATDNVGLFFGEDIVLAIGSILLMKGVLEGYGYIIEPLHFSLWAIPTAIAAFIIHGLRLRRLEKRMAQKAMGQEASA